LRRHVEDVCALARSRSAESGAVLVGHSMGAYIALLAASAEPRLFRRLVLVDGGLPFPPAPEGVSVDDVLAATLGPALDRLSMTFESEQAYLDFFRSHPALTADWNDDIADYVRYDLTGVPGQMRSRVVGDAGARRRARPTGTGRGLPRGLGRSPGPDRVAARTSRHVRAGPRPPQRGRRRGGRPPPPDITIETVADANHYTIVLADRFAAQVARHIEAGGTP
jgi:pimeloyl-ACP methyl ester carboxylesterase